MAATVYIFEQVKTDKESVSQTRINKKLILASCLVNLFNGISNFYGLFNAKPSDEAYCQNQDTRLLKRGGPIPL